MDLPPALPIEVQATGGACARCHIPQTDPARPFYPLWFEAGSQQYLCPACASAQQTLPPGETIALMALAAIPMTYTSA